MLFRSREVKKSVQDEIKNRSKKGSSFTSDGDSCGLRRKNAEKLGILEWNCGLSNPVDEINSQEKELYERFMARA